MSQFKKNCILPWVWRGILNRNVCTYIKLYRKDQAYGTNDLTLVQRKKQQFLLD